MENRQVHDGDGHTISLYNAIWSACFYSETSMNVLLHFVFVVSESILLDAQNSGGIAIR